jgi:hypothetical protein
MSVSLPHRGSLAFNRASIAFVPTKGRNFTLPERKRNPTLGALYKNGYYPWFGLTGRLFVSCWH